MSAASPAPARARVGATVFARRGDGILGLRGEPDESDRGCD